MGLRASCGRCAAMCYERNPLIARMLGLCPLLAITDSATDGVIFGGFFVLVLCLSALLVPGSRYLVTRSMRPLMFQLGVAVIVAALGVLVLSRLYTVTASYGVYLGLIAANCLVLDYVQACTERRRVLWNLLDAMAMAVVIWISVFAFGALREALATGSLQAAPIRDGVGLGSIPLAASPAGALILLGLVAAAANAARGVVHLGVERASPVADPEPAA